MRENRLRTLWRDDRAAINGWLAIPDGFAAETMAHQGWDTLTIDCSMACGVQRWCACQRHLDHADRAHRACRGSSPASS
jgi:2-keto-3-deoxy-L-rhamnonate aldolase RhmA